jgi:hypothetical protein
LRGSFLDSIIAFSFRWDEFSAILDTIVSTGEKADQTSSAKISIDFPSLGFWMAWAQWNVDESFLANSVAQLIIWLRSRKTFSAARSHLLLGALVFSSMLAHHRNREDHRSNRPGRQLSAIDDSKAARLAWCEPRAGRRLAQWSWWKTLISDQYKRRASELGRSGISLLDPFEQRMDAVFNEHLPLFTNNQDDRNGGSRNFSLEIRFVCERTCIALQASAAHQAAHQNDDTSSFSHESKTRAPYQNLAVVSNISTRMNTELHRIRSNISSAADNSKGVLNSASAIFYLLSLFL